MKKNWYRIQAKANAAAEVWIYDEIGLFGITAKDFIDDLKALGEVSEITLAINSPGGDVFDGLAIYNSLKFHPAKVTARIDGIAASIASLIAMAGDMITMPENAMMMIHNPWTIVLGDADELKEAVEALDKIKLAIVSAYRRSGKSDQEIGKIMDDETWFTAQEAVANGFADEVLEPVKIAAYFDLSKFGKAPDALRAQASPRTPAPAPAVPDRIVGVYATEAEGRLIDQANAIVTDRNNRQLKSETMKEAAAIVKACVDGGHPELAADFFNRALTLDQVKAELEKPEHVAGAAARYAAAAVKEIFEICNRAGVADMAEEFIKNGATVEAVKDRLKHAANIRARCAAAKMPDRATAYIRAGMTSEEVGKNLLEIMAAIQGPEIDNKLGPEVGAGAPRSRINTTEIYERYRRPNGSAADLGRKIAKVIQDHGTLR